MSSQGNRSDQRSGSRITNRDAMSPMSMPSSSPVKFPNPTSPMSQLSQVSRVSKATKNLTQNSQADFSDMFRSSPLHYGSETGFNLKSSSQHSSFNAFRNRVDLQKDSNLIREVYVHNENQENVANNILSSQNDINPSQISTASSTNQHLVIWGTDVSIGQCKERFKQFLCFNNFNLENLDTEELELIKDVASENDNLARSRKALYMQKLEEIYTLEDPFLNLNCHHLYEFDKELYRKLINYPQEVIPIFDMAVNEVFYDLYPDMQLPHPINIRPYKVLETNNIRSLDPEDINKLKTISGMVIRCSTIIPEMREAFFKCSVCDSTKQVEVDRGRISEPSLCTRCNSNYSYQLIHNRSSYIDKQQVKLQESPEEIPAGQTPCIILLYACADLVDSVQPGDRVTVTGIYRATPVRSNPRQRTVKSVYRTHLDVVHYRKVDNKRLHDENKLYHFSSERIDHMKAMSLLPDIYERLAHAIAPSIYEHEDIKKGILLQLFGGTKKEVNLQTIVKRRHFRSEINILLCGDPGTSKSQMLKYVYDLVPRGQYTSGKGSSAVGLTAHITKDPDSRQMVLQPGSLVLADGGICCIDEFDKMSDSTRSILHEVMESQTLSIAKAGIVCQLNARTSVLAAANPVESQWNKNKTIIENIQLPHTLISRFDLIYLLLDPHDDIYDRRLAKHLISFYYKSHERDDNLLDISFLKDYIAYAKNFVHPKLSKEAAKVLTDNYVEMRKAGAGKGLISAYPRQLESLIRLAEAHAKVRLSNQVDLVDVDEAIRLHREAIKQSATDPASGKIDISILTTGLSSTNRKRKVEVTNALKNLLNNMSKISTTENMQFSYPQVYNELKMNSKLMITKEMFEDALRELQENDFVTVYGEKFIRLIS